MSAGKHTPAQRAAQALSSADAMCALLAQCRTYRVDGWWDGSAFRSHPCGLIVDTIKFTNHWHVDKLCDIEITDGAGWDRNVCTDSLAYGNPHPKPINGSAVRAWRMGAWKSAEMQAALMPRVLQILTEAAEHIERATEAQHQAEAQRAAQAQAQRAAVEVAAIAKATGAAA